MTITERDGRLIIQFWEPDYKTLPNGEITVSVAQRLVQEIDLTAHFERAVENVLAKRD